MSNAENKSFSGRSCGECARFKVPDSGCDYYEDIRRGTMRRSDPACENFYQAYNKKKEDKEKPAVHKASGLAEEGYYEAVYNNGKPAFLVKTSNGFRTLEAVTDDGKQVVPKEWPSEIPYDPYGAYEGQVPNREELFWKIRDEFDLFLDVESIYKEFLAACVLLSYQQENIRTVPYPYFVGDTDSGKTVGLTLLSKLCYRALFGVTIPAPDIYGYLDDCDAPGTILEDEAQGLWKDMDKSKIYKAGYKQGAVAPRTIITQHKRFIKYFRVFCFKAFAAEDLPRVKGLLERFIVIQMVDGSPKKDWADVDKEDEKRLRNLRDTLLKWRLQTKEVELPDADLPVKGRLKELWKPIIQITQGLTVEKDLRNFLTQLQQERMNEKINTLEGHIIKVVVDLYTPGKPLPFTAVWNNLVTDLEGKLDDKKPNKMDTPDFGEVTKQKLGYRLRDILSGKKRRLRDSEGPYWAYVFEEAKIKRMAKKYGYDFVLKFSSCSTSRGVLTEEKPGKVHENAAVSMGKDLEKKMDTQEKVSSLENLRTDADDRLEDHRLNDSAPTVKINDKANLEPEPLVQEVLERIHSTFGKGTDSEWIRIAMENGMSRRDAEEQFEKSKGEELLWDPTEDVWVWNRK